MSRFFSMCVFFGGWWGAGPSTQPPTWRTIVSLFVWVLSFDLSGKGGLTSSYATSGIALRIIAPRKPPYPAKDAFVKVEIQSQLSWYGHVQRMAEERLPKIALKWMPKQKRSRGRPKKNWMEGIKKAMNERNLNEGQWKDRKQWSLGVGQRRKTFLTRCIHIYIFHV